MSDKKNKWVLFLIIVILVLQSFSLLRISTLGDWFNTIQNQLNIDKQQSRSELAELRYNIEQQLEAQASIIDSYDYSFGAVNTEALTVALDITVFPKELAADSSAELLLGGTAHAMQRQGDSFNAQLEVGLFQEMEQPRLVLESQGLRQQQTIDDLWLEPRSAALPQLNAWLEHSGDGIVFKSNVDDTGTYYLNGTVMIDVVDKSGNSGAFSDLCLLVLVDDQIVFSRSAEQFAAAAPQDGRPAPAIMVSAAGDSLIWQIEGDIEIKIGANQLLQVLVQGQDSYGLLHQMPLDIISFDAEGEPQWDHGLGGEMILDQEGNILWQPEYY